MNNLQESLLVQTLGFVSKDGAIGGQESKALGACYQELAGNLIISNVVNILRNVWVIIFILRFQLSSIIMV